MLSSDEQGTHYGNLQYYKNNILPNSLELLKKTKTQTKNFERIREIFKVLILRGSSTTWEMAKIPFPNDVSRLRTREKEYRRLIIGRNDRGKHYFGLLELGLIVKDGLNYSRAPANKYRLSLHGILFCINMMNLNDDELSVFADNYSHVLPKIFGKWKFLRENIGAKTNKIKILAKGVLLDGTKTSDDQNSPFFDLMSYVHTKYHRNYEKIDEDVLAEQISYWFYTSLLYSPISDKKLNINSLITILKLDKNIFQWYTNFYREAKTYYESRLLSIITISL